ncbi:uncharacterized protein FFE2_08597 [Fusarium fujikuroi]|uniref:Uncharacterized protein n=1 Tax=Fusarium fujikuroi TaxID=5127 RepID=A0A9Q9RRI6_FUSFU|nr:uncharacterized protein FFE2_08597 [Fusarium fujikuroi]VTT74604.1 unnamed protein product [Fusarium fujikuroi]
MNESHQRKRRPQEQEESNRPNKRQTKTPKTPKEAPRDAALAAARQCLDERPVYSDYRLDDHIRPDPDVEFAASYPEEEAEAMALFDASQSKLDFDKFCPEEAEFCAVDGVPVQPSSVLERQPPTSDSLIGRNRSSLAQYLTPNSYTTLKSQGGEVPSLEDKVDSLRR